MTKTNLGMVQYLLVLVLSAAAVLAASCRHTDDADGGNTDVKAPSDPGETTDSAEDTARDDTLVGTDTLPPLDTDTVSVVDPNTGDDTDTNPAADTHSDTDTDTVCTDVAPCGGDLVGTWKVISSCLATSGALDMTALGLGEYCTATVQGALTVTGTWTVSADGSYSDNTATTGVELIEMSTECRGMLPVSSGKNICSRANGPVAAAGYASVDCQDNSEEGCTCTAVVDQNGGLGVAPLYPEAGGDVTIEGNFFTLNDAQKYTYCVLGTALTITPKSTKTTGTVTGSVVLQMQ